MLEIGALKGEQDAIRVGRSVSDRVSAAPALSPAEAERASRVTLRVCDELTRLIDSVPKSGRTAMSLARDLKVDRNTCQRALSALASTADPLQALLRLPGPRGLRQMVEAMSRSSGRSSRRATLSAAVDQFEAMVWDFGPSQTKLAARVRATVESHAFSDSAAGVRDLADPTAGARREHFRTAAGLMGVEMETQVTVGVIRPLANEPGFFEQFGVTGWIGLRARDLGVPLSAGSATLRDRMGDVAERVRVTPLGTPLTNSDGLIEEFSTRPFPNVSSRSEAGVAWQFVDLPGRKPGETSDVILARHRTMISDPRKDDDPVWSQIARVKYPARRLVLDLFLHRSVAVGTPWPASYFWHPSLTGHPQHHWHERLPGTPRVSILGVGIGTADTAMWPRHRPLLAHMFSLVGWSPDDFIGFRCEIEYPVWGAAYFLTFAFDATR